ncbi:hypothetical protein NL676_022645 [Syzygium grande]|nr:hypothetical protein NL676_022645 [Syzygium grande]
MEESVVEAVGLTSCKDPKASGWPVEELDQDSERICWKKNMEGEIYLAFFNLNQDDMVIAAHVSDLAKGLPSRSVTSCTGKEIWTDTDYIQPMNDTVAAMVDSHDSALFVLNCN